MPVARYRHAAVAVKNKIFLVGGRDANETLVEQVDVSTLEASCMAGTYILY